MLVLLSDIGIIPVFTTQVPDCRWQDIWYTIIRSVTLTTAALMIFADRRYKKALKDERFLKKIRVQENDERENTIMIYARSAGCQVALIIGFVGAIVTGYFSMTVSITLWVFTVIQAIIVGIFQSHYRRRF